MVPDLKHNMHFSSSFPFIVPSLIVSLMNSVKILMWVVTSFFRVMNVVNSLLKVLVIIFCFFFSKKFSLILDFSRFDLCFFFKLSSFLLCKARYTPLLNIKSVKITQNVINFYFQMEKSTSTFKWRRFQCSDFTVESKMY